MSDYIYRVVLANGEIVSVKGPLSYVSNCLEGLGAQYRSYTPAETPVNNWADVNSRESIEFLNARAMRAQLEVLKKQKPFAEVVQNLCVIAHLPFDPNDAEITVQNLIQWNVQVATDPTVSKDAYNLHRQITARNEFLARDILPLTDKLDGVDPRILDKLRHYISESPGDTPYDPTEFENLDVSEFDRQDRHPDPEMESDVAAGREAARRRLEKRKAPNVLRSQAQADAPKWLVRRQEELRKGAALAARRKALNLKREQLAALIGTTAQKIRRVECGLSLIGTKTIRPQMARELRRLEELKRESENG
jgi:hypothetical protein